ncbi:MAG: YraN family protein [Deltaproteobacteria bacterium]
MHIFHWKKQNTVMDTNLGLQGEEAAVRYLQARGYKILERNFRCRAGEVDIIAEEKGDLVFVEVKARSSNRFGDPAEAVTSRKQGQISKAALCYLGDRHHGKAARFDVVTVLFSGNRVARVEIIRDAFELAYGH